MMAVVAAALLVITACDKKDDDDNSGGNSSEYSNAVTLTAPPYKDVAMVLNLQSNSQGITQLRIMESGAYMIARESGSAVRKRTSLRDDVPLDYEFGKFTYTDGKFVFDNGMTISFTPSGQGYEITITWKNGTTITTTGTIDTSSSVTSGVLTDNLCSHPWTIERLIAKGNFGGTATPGVEFKGPINLAVVKEWYEKNFGTLQDQFDASAIIEGIFFDAHGLFAINYKNRKDDVGVWRWTNMNDGKLVYNWNNATQAISLFTGNAAVGFKKNPDSCKLTLSGTVNGVALEFVFYLKY